MISLVLAKRQTQKTKTGGHPDGDRRGKVLMGEGESLRARDQSGFGRDGCLQGCVNRLAAKWKAWSSTRPGAGEDLSPVPLPACTSGPRQLSFLP